MRWGAVVAVALATAVAGCGLFGKRKPPRPAPVAIAEPGSREQGIASWYGPGFHGRRTANGEIYNQFAMTAAHQTLPADTRVRVTNLTNGRSVVVRINDRGPFVDDRIIDLSYAAAREIEMIGPGTAPVRLEVLAPDWIEPAPPPVQVAEAAPPPRTVPVAVSAAVPVDPPRVAPAAAPINVLQAARSRTAVAATPPSRYAVQVAAFSNYERARRTQRLLEQQGAAARLGLVEEAGMRYYRLRLGPYTRQDDAARTAQRINALGYPALIVADGASWQ
jgi:rare lipoprotein A